MNLQSLPWWGRLLLFSGLAAVVLYIGYQMYPGFSEIQKDIAVKEQELGKLQAEIQKGRGALKRRAELEAQIHTKEVELSLLRRILPTEPETGDLVKWLKAQADQVNLDLLQFTRGTLKNNEFYREHMYAMVLVGDYHDLGEFFERVSGHDRLINIQGLSITANPNPRLNRSVRTSFTAVTFVYQGGMQP